MTGDGAVEGRVEAWEPVRRVRFCTRPLRCLHVPEGEKRRAADVSPREVGPADATPRRAPSPRVCCAPRPAATTASTAASPSR